jgi:hypothetical protein
MIPLFPFASNDVSLEYLIQIFGSMNGVIINPSNPSSGGVSITLLGTMFQAFNTILLAVGVLIVLYVTIVGIMKTAHEGTPMGQHWSSLWIPIRMVLGVASLVPTGSGYCAIQIIMMWVIVQGIGAADLVWNTVLSYVNIVGSPYGQVTIPSSGVYNSFNGLFEALTCEASARMKSADPTGIASSSGGGYYCLNNSSGYCTGGLLALSSNPSQTTYSIGPGGSCGVLTYCNQSAVCSNQNSLKCTSCKAQVAALTQIIPVFVAIAEAFTQADYTYRRFYYNSWSSPTSVSASWITQYCSDNNIPQSQCCVPSIATSAQTACKGGQPGVPGNVNFPTPNNSVQNASDQAVERLIWPYVIQPLVGGNVDFIGTAVTEYTNSVGAAVSTYILEQGKNPNNLSGPLQTAQSSGWALAGAYYYLIAQSNNNNIQDSLPTITMVVENPYVDSSNTLHTFRTNTTAAVKLEALASNQSAFGGAFAGNSQMSQLGGVLGAATTSAQQTFTSTVSGQSGSNPLSAMQITGAVLLSVVVVTYPVFMAVSFALGLISNISWLALGTGLPRNPIGAGVVLLYYFLVPGIFALLGLMITLGATLGIYIPLIPFIVFTFGVIGWFTMVIEAMVAGPLVALSMLYPSGEELLGKAQTALIYLFDVFLRPSLMIFGLMAAMLLATAMVAFVSNAFWTIVLPTNPAALTPLGFFIYLTAYVTTLVAVLNKCFAVIYVVPQGVMKWIGAQGAAYGGEAEGAEAFKGGVTKGAGGAEGFGKGAHEGLKGTAEKGGQHRAAEKEYAATVSGTTAGTTATTATSKK